MPIASICSSPVLVARLLEQNLDAERLEPGSLRKPPLFDTLEPRRHRVKRHAAGQFEA